MERRPLKRLKRFLRYGLVRALVFLVSLLPVRAALGLGAAAGRLGFRFAGRERRKALEGLAVAFPERSEAERTLLARQTFEHLGACAAEICCLPSIDPRIEQWVELPEADKALLDAALAPGKGVIFVSGHVGNFELLARRIAMGGYPCQTIAREASDPRTTAFIEKMRAAGRLKTIWRGKDGAARDMIRALRKGEILGLLIDQDTRVQGVFVDFFGRKAFTPRAAADLALRTGAAVVCGFISRHPDGRHRISLETVPAPQSGDREADVLDLTQALTLAIEAAIRRQPHAWVWMHPRWKTRPDPQKAVIDGPSAELA